MSGAHLKGTHEVVTKGGGLTNTTLIGTDTTLPLSNGY